LQSLGLCLRLVPTTSHVDCRKKSAYVIVYGEQHMCRTTRLMLQQIAVAAGMLQSMVSEVMIARHSVSKFDNEGANPVRLLLMCSKNKGHYIYLRV